jgi:hypothetical protein
MSDFLEKAKTLGARAAEGAKDAGEIGKYKVSMQSKKGDINDEMAEIGKYMYSKYQEEGEDSIDAPVIEHAKKIDELNQAIQELQAKIDAVKED